MKLTFVNSPLQDYGRVKKKDYYTTPPLGLGYLATIAKTLGCKAELIDAEALGLSPQQIVSKIQEQKPDVAGLNLLSPTLGLSKQVIQGLRAENSRIKIFVGGPHATIRPEQILRSIPEIDILVRGEGELTLEELIQNDLNPLNIKGISFRNNGDIIHNPNRELSTNLASLPFIDRGLFVNDPYRQENRDLKSVIIGSRGCPYLCTFCAGPLVSGRKIRTRSIENIVDEIEILKQEYGVDSIHFIDNDFVYNKTRVLHFADEIERRNLEIKWKALARVDVVSRFGKQFLEKIKKAGCYRLIFGIESGCQRILDMVKKGTNPEQAKEAVSLCKKVGIKTKAYYLFGFPTETLDEMEQTLEHAIDLDTDTAYFLLVKAYPGTEMYDKLVGKYGEEELQKYIHLQGIVAPEKISQQMRNFGKYNICNTLSFSRTSNEDLIGMLRKAYKMYYADGRRRHQHKSRELVEV